MNRKTNIFYLNGNDSKFLTFSNYTEYLTGTFLSTNTKMFLSSFLVFNLPFDENHTILNFKIFLTTYYENKLATIRDYYEENGSNSDDNRINALYFLLEAINKYFGIAITSTEYTGDIVEHDYNGTYADSACIIDLNRYRQTTIEFKAGFNYNTYTDESYKFLYGWGPNVPAIYDFTSWSSENPRIQYGSGKISVDSTVISENDKIGIKVIENSDPAYIGKIYYVNKDVNPDGETLYPLYNEKGEEVGISVIITSEQNSNDQEQSDIYWPKFDFKNDTNPFYDITSFIESIETKEKQLGENISFNCIIPLFDVYNIKKSKYYIDEKNQDINNQTVDDTSENNQDINNQTDDDTNDYTNYKGIPYGIWISENPVTLFNESPFKQTWTLTISSKFSPFPYHIKDGVKSETSDTDITSNVNLTTYTDLLAQQSELIEKYKEALNIINSLKNEINEYKIAYNAISSLYSIDEIKLYVDNALKDMQEQVDDSLGEMNEKLNNIIWKKIG